MNSSNESVIPQVAESVEVMSSGSVGNQEHIDATKAKPTKKGKPSHAEVIPASKVETMYVDADKIEVLSYREKRDPKVVAALVEMINEGIALDPLQGVPVANEKYRCPEGEYRLMAFKQLNRQVPLVLFNGIERDVFIASLSANAKHCEKRTNEDRRNAVLAALGDDEFRDKSHSEIARLTGTSHTFVANVRKGKVGVKAGKRSRANEEAAAESSPNDSNGEVVPVDQHEAVAALGADISVVTAGDTNAVLSSADDPVDVEVDRYSILTKVLAMLQNLPDGDWSAADEGNKVLKDIQRELERLLVPKGVEHVELA